MKTMLLSDKNSHSNLDAISELDQRRGKIISHTGGWFPGKGVFCHGYSMLEELVGEKTYIQILVLNATGKLIDKELAAWVEAIYGCLSWPDPRIWCNQIGALAGTARASVMAATAMGALAADSRSYGVFPIIEGMKFIQSALTQIENGLSVEDVLNSVSSRGGKPLIVGYIRPIAKGDERIEAMERISKKLNLSAGKHMLLAYEIEKVLLEKYDERMNINGYVAAFLSDYNFSGQEVYQMFTMLVASGVTACYLDTYHQPPNSFLPLRCDDIDYQGAVQRSVPVPVSLKTKGTSMQKTALITGGNSGIGFATAKLLKEKNYAVTICGRDEGRVAQAAKELGVTGIVADIGNADQVQQLIAHFADKPLDVLVNNAALARFMPLAFCSGADFDEFFNVNVRGPLDLIKGVLPSLEKTRGSITNISSAVVNNGLANAALYAATKGALESVSKSLAIEFAPIGVRVNVVAPGAVDTPIIHKLGLDEQIIPMLKAQMESTIPLRRYGTADEIAAVIVAQLESTYTTGAIWRVDGGVDAT